MGSTSPFDGTLTLDGILAAGRAGDAAILSVAGGRLTFAGVQATVARSARQLHDTGLERGDRIAIVVGNGPGAALAFLAAAACGAAAPLNPAYTEGEFRFYLGDLGARALITDGTAQAAVEAAAALGIARIDAADTGRGLTLRLPPPSRAAADAAPPSPADVALVLHTSGTTGQPKRVPLTQANLAASAKNIVASLQLSPGDRCLNVMPLFHIHGLVAAVLASLAAGGSVICTPGFDAFRTGDWLRTLSPTWYSAVPTMHHAIARRLASKDGGRFESNLRFVRSASSALPAVTAAEVERLFGVPMIEAYGMTEAAHQVATNPLPPGERVAGSVGKAAGLEVAIVSPDGGFAPAGARGEVGIRGDNVTAGYEGAPSPGREGVPGGWFRTGDEGYLDTSGYLFLTGRLKEIINRGGEKVAPREVEEVLLMHPSVRQAVVFAVPHPTLGEEVAAAVVAGEQADPRTLPRLLRTFAGERLAPFKVPRSIVVVDELPLGPTGKVQRIGMAERLGLAR